MVWTAELVCFRIIRNPWTRLKGGKSLFFLIKETEYHLIHSWGDGNPHEQPQTDPPPLLLLKISHLTHSCLKLWAHTRSHTLLIRWRLLSSQLGKEKSVHLPLGCEVWCEKWTSTCLGTDMSMSQMLSLVAVTLDYLTHTQPLCQLANPFCMQYQIKSSRTLK